MAKPCPARGVWGYAPPGKFEYIYIEIIPFNGCSRSYPGGGRKHFFCPVGGGEGVLLTMCPRGGGWRGNLSWGSRHI